MTSSRSPQRTNISDSLSGLPGAEDSPEFDETLRESVQKISIGLYDFLASTRRLGERPNARMDISQSEMEVLHFISTHPGCGVSDIARLRFLRPSNVSATVRRLLDNGLIERENNAKDRRAQNLYVSKDGEHLLSQLIDHWGALVYEIVRTMSGKDVRALIKALPSLLKLAEHSESFIEEHQRHQEPF